jgi:glycosyltransferase involved in cell wall biosynthesis
MKSRVSVVIPTYRAAAFIRATLESVFAQTVAAREVLVVDDHSPDDTVAIVESIARTAPVPVRLLTMSRNSGGPAAPLNRGIRMSAGPYIATLDQDDRMRPRRLELQLACADAQPDLGLVIGPVNPIVEESRAIPEYLDRIEKKARNIPSHRLGPGMRAIRSSNAYNALVSIGCFGFTCSTFLFRKTIWEKVKGFDAGVRLTCDFAFMESVLRDHDVGVVDEVVADWQLHETSLTNAADLAEKERDCFRVLSKFKNYLLEPAERQMLDAMLAVYCRELGYQSRQQGRYADAVRCYVVGLRPNVIPLHSAAAMLKLLPHYVFRGLWRMSPG